MLDKRLVVGSAILVLGIILLSLSQVAFKGEYYDLVDVVSFSAGQPLEFYWSFEANYYRFEVKAINWTYPSPYIHWISISNDTLYRSGEEGIIEPPYVWYEGFNTTILRVAWWHYGENDSRVIETANAGAYVDISELKQKVSQPTELAYVGAPLIAMGGALILIIERARHRHT